MGMLSMDIRQGDGSTTRVDDGKVEELAAALNGPLVQPGEAGHDEARTIWNGMIDRRPTLIARCSVPY